ncbi:flagellar biosynthesis protein FlhB [Paenibacillus spiritus]|uniref:Flagellar biosynthetic protein FlhB n=1 Tax=Paenibacillus spiritus TaxID=2496557 RepID=A0A5J5GEA3_9BACL|nr:MULTISPECIES: flagellar biosynthesis protein FlhB [Paenibacillus]KAA9006407.1 flagellar biosynthesis protein FlhB [Paenibacillus spiritus]
MSYRYRLDLQLFGGEKTEKATPKKRGDARRKGQVARSAELGSAIVLLAGVLSLVMFGGYIKERFMKLFMDVFVNRLTMEVTPNNVMGMLSHYAVQILLLLAPMLLLTFILAFITGIAQVGFMFNGTGLTPKLGKLNPISGFKNIFSMRALVELFKSLLKLGVIGYLVFSVLWGRKDELADLAHFSAEQTFRFASGITINLGIRIGAALLVLAALDFMYQRYEHEKSLRMSKQDIKDEYKNMEGDPLIKGKIRERQRRMAMQRMMQEVPKADVIITNPTHFAVALKYEGSSMDAPQVIAKGQDYIALRIREIARQNGVTTMENKPLARALFQRAEIGDSVPADLFQAVAEVLAYVYKLKGRTR